MGSTPGNQVGRSTQLYLVSSPGWDKSEYQVLTKELLLYNVETTIVPSSESLPTDLGPAFWMYHGLAGPLHELYFPSQGCGLILLGVPKSVPVGSILPNVRIPDKESPTGQWFQKWRDKPTNIALPDAAVLSFSSAKDYLAPPEQVYRLGSRIDFVRLGPLNGLPELTHSEMVSSPVVAELIGKWTVDRPCSY